MSEDTRLREAHERIAALPQAKQREALRRLSRSYSGSLGFLADLGARLEGDDVVWPDGERFPRPPEPDAPVSGSGAVGGWVPLED